MYETDKKEINYFMTQCLVKGYRNGFRLAMMVDAVFFSYFLSVLL